MAPVEEVVGLLDLDRSNKGASKQRRDQINAEINILRDLLPLPESSRQRLSQLQVMSLSCVYIRKCNVLQKLFRLQSQEPHLPDLFDFFQAMTGFLLVTTREGKLIYISENVTDYLGHSMVDMKTQGDSLYDIIDKRDHSIVQAKLLQGGALAMEDVSEDVSFFCRMNMSRTLKRQSGFGDVKVMHIRGHFVAMNVSENSCLGDKQYVFMAACSPLMTPDLKENLVLNNTMVFKTVHHLDMGFLEVTKMAEHHLGQTSEELCKKSWYTMIHPEDIHEAKEKHMQLVRSNHHEVGCMMTVRMIKADGSIFWVNIVMHVKHTLLSQSDEPYIVCINQIISAQEAYQIRVQGQMFSMYPGRVEELWGNHMPNSSPSQNFNNQWVQQDGNSSVPVPSYHCTMSGYPNQQGYQMMYPGACSSTPEIERARKSCQKTPQYGVSNLVQTDKLKAMLKRKIQGPAPLTEGRQVKVPKMSWDVDSRPIRPQYHKADLVMSEQYTSGKVGEVMGPQSQVVQVMMATTNHHPPGVFSTKSFKSSPERLVSDFTSVSSHTMKVEQVVPDVNVPESYLTPEPSPVSSPEPSHIKSEVMDPDEVGMTSSTSILQALEKLVSEPQQKLPTKTPLASIRKPEERGSLDARKARNKELPIFDAFDIDFFFDTLDLPVNDSKASYIMDEMRIKQEVDVNPAKKNAQMNRVKSQELDIVPQSVLKEGPQFPCLMSQMEMPMLSIKMEKDETTCRKDQCVSSTMIHSPQSVSSQGSMTKQKSFDDLLSCFSDEGLTLSPFDRDSIKSDLDSSFSTSSNIDPLDIQIMSSLDSMCQTPLYLSDHRTMEELSPQSNSSFLSREDDTLEKTSVWNFDMDFVNSSPQKTDPQSQDGSVTEDVFDQMDFLLDSLVPS